MQGWLDLVEAAGRPSNGASLAGAAQSGIPSAIAAFQKAPKRNRFRPARSRFSRPWRFQEFGWRRAGMSRARRPMSRFSRSFDQSNLLLGHMVQDRKTPGLAIVAAHFVYERHVTVPLGNQGSALSIARRCGGRVPRCACLDGCKPRRSHVLGGGNGPPVLSIRAADSMAPSDHPRIW